MKILVVEDEYMTRTGLSHLLEKISESYCVTCAEDGYEGMLIAEKYRPDVIFTDIKMPKMDGFQMISHLHEIALHAKIVVLTGYADFEYARQSISLGVFDYLLKPVSVGVLRELLQRLESQQLSLPEEQKNKTQEQYSLLVHKLMRAIETGYQQKLTLEGFAKQFSVTPEYLSGLFSREAGTPFIHYLKKVRVEKAKALLKIGDKRVYEVAFDVGYPDVKYFCRVFKELTGMSPRQYVQHHSA